MRHVTWTRRCYFVPWDNGSMLVGATVEEAGFDEARPSQACTICSPPRARGAARLDGRVSRRARRPAPATADGLPIIGALDSAPNVMFASDTIETACCWRR